MSLFLFSCGSQKLFNGKENVKYALGDLIVRQREMDEQIKGYMNDESYTFDDPLILNNPYEIAPLTALIIFNTKEATAIDVDINGMFSFVVEKDTTHAIPVYGLLDARDNTVILKDDNGNTKELIITTEEYKGDRLRVEILKEEELDDQVFFLSPNFVENCIFDKYGNLLWYIKDDYAGDIEFLDNGHFLISDPHQGTNGVKINYSSFLEMDYLGKIHKQYITEYGYHHELVPMDDGAILTTGALDGSAFLEAVLFEMDMETGKSRWMIDFYEKLHEIAPEWIESLGTQFDFVLNSIDYDKENNDVLLSFRGIGVIALYDLDEDDFIWMFGDPDNLPDEFDKYLLSREDDIKYPYGQHSAFFTEDGNISFHNNDADQLNSKGEMLGGYLDNYTTNVIFAVDMTERSVRRIWEYDADKKEWSKVGGMLTMMDNGHKLIDYGFSEKEKAYEDPDNISINDTDYLQGIIMELDENDEVLFRGTMDGLIFRTFKTDLYPDKIDNYETGSYRKINGYDKESEKIDIESIRNDLLKADKAYTDAYVLIDRLFVDEEFEIRDEVKAILVNENDEAYVVPYKQKDESLPVFNSGRYGIKFHVPEGSYKIYLSVNDKYYDTDTVIVFE